VAGDGSQKLPVRLIPTVRARVAAAAPAPRCAQLLAAWAACLCGPRARGLAVADAALDALLDAAPAGRLRLRADTAPPAGAVRRLLSLPGFLDPTVPGECEFVREVELAGRDLWYTDVHVALAHPQPHRQHVDRPAAADREASR
jgi:fructuronate reductase